MKCHTCGMPAKDILSKADSPRQIWVFKWTGRKHIPFCRLHLLEQFSTEFNRYPYRMVVFHPCLDGKKGSYNYWFYPLEDMKRQARTEDQKKYLHIVENAVQSISGSCMKCHRTGEVAYFDRNGTTWDGEWPKISVNAVMEVRCKRGALSEIITSLSNFSDAHANGVFCPYKGAGVLMPALV